MAHGKSLELRYVERENPIEPLPHPTPGRDRSLRGKSRRKARKMAQRLESWRRQVNKLLEEQSEREAKQMA